MNQLEALKILRLIVPFLLFLPGCQRQEPPVTPAEPVQELVEHTLYASTPGEDAPETRTMVSADNDTKILWSAKESISVLSGGGNYLFKGNNDAAAPSANFTGMGPANLGSYIALYPYDVSATYSEGYVSTALPASQIGKAGSFADGYLVTADDATGNSISFNHVCSGLRFMVNRADIKAVTIRGNNGEKIAGDFRFRFASEDTPVAGAGTETCVTLQAPGGHFETGTYYYIVILPTAFSKGFTLMADTGSQVGELRFDSSVTFTAGKFKNIDGNLNERMTWTTPSSQVYYGHENSFCIRPGETISFDVNPRKIYGTWQRSGLPASAPVPDEAELLWGGGSISSVSFYASKLTVTASGTPGSALVAIKKNGTILWSYLIWVTESAPAETTLPGGAVIQPTLGGNCYFQWGRKDPLVEGGSSVDNQGDNGLAYSIQHPDHYIGGGSSIYDWFTHDPSNLDDNLWGGSLGGKTVWDPCPEGWRVPTETDFNGLTEDYAASFDKFGILVPDGNKTKHNDAYGWDAWCWTREAADTYSESVDTNVYALLMQTDGYGFIGFSMEGSARSLGLSVRCVKEQTIKQ